MTEYETFEHEADVGVRGFGKTMEEAFQNGAKAMFSVMVELDKVDPKKKIGINCEALDNETLFVEWLNELLSTADIEDMVFFTLGTGIGGGVVVNGRLVKGCCGNAAELGHIIIYPNGRQCNCGQRGCVEAYASASSTAARAAEAVRAGEQSSLKKVLEEKGQITCKDVYEHLAAGDKLAKKITDETAEALAIVCVNMLHTIEPERIVFSGGMIAAGDVLLGGIRHFFKKHIWTLKAESPQICFATLGEDAGIIGAAALAKQAQKAGK